MKKITHDEIKLGNFKNKFRLEKYAELFERVYKELEKYQLNLFDLFVSEDERYILIPSQKTGGYVHIEMTKDITTEIFTIYLKTEYDNRLIGTSNIELFKEQGYVWSLQGKTEIIKKEEFCRIDTVGENTYKFMKLLGNI